MDDRPLTWERRFTRARTTGADIEEFLQIRGGEDAKRMVKNGWDPFNKLERLPFPTVALIDGKFRQNLEETDMGYGFEVDMIRTAHELGMLTTPYCFNADEATAMAKAGADILIPHMGLTTKGTIGASTTLTLEECVPLIQAMHDAAKRVKPDILVLCHGGPIAEPADAQFILDRTEGIVGFYGASSMERLPVEPAIRDRVREFTELQFKR